MAAYVIAQLDITDPDLFEEYRGKWRLAVRSAYRQSTELVRDCGRLKSLSHLT